MDTVRKFLLRWFGVGAFSVWLYCDNCRNASEYLFPKGTVIDKGYSEYDGKKTKMVCRRCNSDKLHKPGYGG